MTTHYPIVVALAIFFTVVWRPTEIAELSGLTSQTLNITVFNLQYCNITKYETGSNYDIIVHLKQNKFHTVSHCFTASDTNEFYQASGVIFIRKA